MPEVAVNECHASAVSSQCQRKVHRNRALALSRQGACYQYDLMMMFPCTVLYLAPHKADCLKELRIGLFIQNIDRAPALTAPFLHRDLRDLSDTSHID